MGRAARRFCKQRRYQTRSRARMRSSSGSGCRRNHTTWPSGGADSLPAIPGSDAAGRREDTGERGLLTSTDGAYAELVAANEENVFAIPDSLNAAAAAALGAPYMTAWWSIVYLGGLKERDTLLVQGAPTATGQASVDIGVALGAKVYATAPAGKLDAVRALGAEAFAYGDANVRQVEANVVFDPIGPMVSTASRLSGSRGRL
jgi:NADPH:quinone reductase-like Zn-dependent oxidoreductase